MTLGFPGPSPWRRRPGSYALSGQPGDRGPRTGSSPRGNPSRLLGAGGDGDHDFIGPAHGRLSTPNPRVGSRFPRRIGAFQGRGRDWLRPSRASSSPGRLCASYTTASAAVPPLSSPPTSSSSAPSRVSPGFINNLYCAYTSPPCTTLPVLTLADRSRSLQSRFRHAPLGLSSLAPLALCPPSLGTEHACSQECINQVLEQPGFIICESHETSR